MKIFQRISRSLAWRLVLPVALVVTIAVSLHITLLSSQRELFIRKLRESERVGKIVEAIILYDMRHNHIHDFRSYLQMLPLGEDLSAIRIYDSEGVLHYAIGDTSLEQKVDRLNSPICAGCHLNSGGKSVKQMNLRRTSQGEMVFQADFPLKNSPECQSCHPSSQTYLGNLLTELTLSQGDMRLLFRRRIMISAGGIVMILAIIAMWSVFQVQVVRPLKRLVRVIESYKRGETSERYTLRRKDEIGYLVNAFNDMMDSLLEFQTNLEAQVETRTRELESSRLQLLFRENLASLGRLAAGIAHELGNPLTGISSIVQLIRRRKKDDPFVVEQLELVHEEINRLSRLSRQMVDLSRPDNTRKTIFNLKEAIGKAYQISHYDNRLKNRIVKLQENKALLMVEANEDAIIQIVMNLLFNAADATENEGFISIEASTGAQNMAEVRVFDNGRGIPEEYRLRIFDPFFSGKGVGGGTGLGLSVSHSLARAFGGDLTLETSGEHGSTFLLKIPLKK